jgi:hypothetical protein
MILAVVADYTYRTHSIQTQCILFTTTTWKIF